MHTGAILLATALTAAAPSAAAGPCDSAPAPSLVFLIENSSGMAAADPAGRRFGLALEMLDSLHRHFPSAEAAFVVFARRPAAIPFATLNHAFPDGRSGLDTLKSLLDQADSDALRHDGVDVGLAFAAAKAILQGARAAKSDQAFVLISDGPPKGVDSARQGMEWEFLDGAGVPATFTLFFEDPDESMFRDSLAKMNDNIRANGYSETNPRSAIWDETFAPDTSGWLLEAALPCREPAGARIGARGAKGAKTGAPARLGRDALGRRQAGRRSFNPPPRLSFP